MSDVWFVRTANGEARMTLDELDAAFQAGAINEQTQVREETSLQWSTLGALLGIESQPPQHSHSVRPVAVDLDDLDELQLKPKKRGVVIALAAGALVLGGLALAVTQLGGSPGGGEAVEKAAAAGGGQAAVVVTPKVTTPDPADQGKPALTEEQRKALEKADKDLAARQSAKQDQLREKRERTQYRPGQKSGPVFQKGGSKYDPLNTNL